ncbi:probable disease resistance protein At4g27220 [Neltuma alba]|uniref:probable disease resistance protein At4g27220 n=1 Tax=Neltuma alba TaxID=207710 RepID=UPI0010A3284E|nr:probable disease resistance protein At4g27220 [Prosopis alba]
MEFLVAIGTGIVSKLGEMLMDPVTSQFKHLIHYDKNINKMKKELNNLQDRKGAIEGMVDADRRNGRHIALNVEHWLNKVDNVVENELHKVYDDEFVNKNKKCLNGLCPNLVFRYSLSKKAGKMAQDLVSLKEQKFDFISYPAPLPTLGSTFTEGIKSFASRESIMAEVVEKLKGDEFNRLSVCGMGGVGKTTLVKELIKILEADKVFDEISMAIVSQVPDYRKIQGQIGDTLGLKFDKETLQGRAGQLLERLNKINKVLVVLDDVWTELDFELIGLPSNGQCHKGCKILFTSRNEDVCHRMISQRNFTMPVLSKEEAWDLFRDTVGGHVADKAEIHNIAKEVANECRGLPIAIVTIAKALGNKEKHAWEDALDQLRKSSLTSFSEMQEYSIYSCIELSYNFLGNKEAKFLLLLCCLFPEDFDIPIEVLLRYGVGLGLFKDLGALCKARNRVHTLVDTLKKRFLLLDSNEEECVKMHDVVRDTVITIGSKEEHGFAVKYDAGQTGSKEFIWHHSAISLVFDEIKMHPKRLQCPNLRLLQVYLKRREPISENFFHNMSKLTVLGISNLCIPSVSSPFRSLNSLCTLRLEDCQVGDISVICKELRKLEVLSFAHSNIKELPAEIGKLSLLRLLDLTECNDLDQMSSGVLASLSNLEELYLRVRNFHWEEKNSILADLKFLSHQLKVLEISITGIHVFPKDLELKSLVKFWIYVRDSTTLSHGFGRRGYLHPNILKLNGVYHNDIKENVAIQQLLKKSEILNLVDVKQLENVIYELDEEGFPHLKNLSIEFCNDLKYLTDETVDASSCVFPLVQSLSLHNLDNLREICHAKSFTSSRQCLGSLSDLKVEFCKKLKYVFSPSQKSSVGMLQCLHVTECYGIECIFSKQIHDGNSVIKFTNLVELKLQELPSLVGFAIPDHNNELHLLNSQVQEQKLEDGQHLLGSNSILGADASVHIGDTVFDLKRSEMEGQPVPMLFSQLKEIEISWLSKLRHIWSNVPSYVQGFQNLRSLKVKKCDALRSIFIPTIARTLAKLQKLEIHSCQLMEKVVGDDDGGEQGIVETLLFAKLDSLTLKDLPNLVVPS